ncbi:hypothetical protein BU17DRAFT_55017 [Hysterangium stoloniferum]|nr:hypothetical protein BU17DRAFT_55017 [Hysterangium stoloniferum]
MASKKNVVIVGGGGAGAALARALSQQLNPEQHALTLISSREFFFHYPAALRMLASPKGELEKRIIIPYDKLFHNDNGSFIRAEVTSIVPSKNGGGHVTTDIHGNIPFDVLVLASGSIWEGGIDLPSHKDQALKFINTWQQKIKAAKNIALIGGGAVGIEFAAEIKEVYEDKKITLIHNKKHLLNSVYPDKFRIDMENRLIQKQIMLVLDDSVKEIPSENVSRIVTVNGVRVDADLVVPTRGGRPNTAFISSSLGSEVVTSDGHVRVENTLQVKGYPGIFAAGDILDWKEVKQVGKYPYHVTTISSNIASYLGGKPVATPYKQLFEGILITVGANGGGTYMDLLWGLCFGNWVTRMLKSNNLFIDKTRQSLGYV